MTFNIQDNEIMTIQTKTLKTFLKIKSY